MNLDPAASWDILKQGHTAAEVRRLVQHNAVTAGGNTRILAAEPRGRLFEREAKSCSIEEKIPTGSLRGLQIALEEEIQSFSVRPGSKPCG